MLIALSSPDATACAMRSSNSRSTKLILITTLLAYKSFSMAILASAIMCLQQPNAIRGLVQTGGSPLLYIMYEAPYRAFAYSKQYMKFWQEHCTMTFL